MLICGPKMKSAWFSFESFEDEDEMILYKP